MYLYLCYLDIFCFSWSYCIYRVLYLNAECHCYRFGVCSRVVYLECENMLMVVISECVNKYCQR